MQISNLDQQRIGLSYQSQEYLRLTREIEVLALQIEAEHHWSATPGFWIAVFAMLAACIAAYPVVLSIFSSFH